MTRDAAPVALAEQLNDVDGIAPERKRPVHDPPLARALERQARSTPWTVGHGSQLYFAPMASRRLDAGIDNLYQLPLGEFTAARNALAKEAGARGGRNPVAAEAAGRRVGGQSAVLARSRHLRSPDRGRRRKSGPRTGPSLPDGKAICACPAVFTRTRFSRRSRPTIDILTKSGQPVTEATRQAIATTLRALPSADPPGRLTRTLQPGGFEMLTGVPVRRNASRESAQTGTVTEGSGRGRCG